MTDLPNWPCLRLGDPANPALVFLHGFLGRKENWLPITSALTSNYYCILVDLPGHGQHIIPPKEPLGFSAAVSSLRQTLDYHNLERPTLVGYSLGGRIALQFAHQCPERVQRLVLESASPGLPLPEDRLARVTQDDRLAAELHNASLQDFLPRWYAQPLFASLANRPALLAQLMRENSDNQPHQLARALTGFSPGRMQPLWDFLPNLEMPCLLLAGALDPKYAETLRQAALSLPRAQLHIAPNAGHNIHAEQPEWFVQKLADFLDVPTNQSLIT